ncbi:MAG TPA: VWA domain-containing protein [Thermoanaerobaculia bacterium]|nr:VWA domain-containing protein [Thermoanaerobaculia bacterium]
MDGAPATHRMLALLGALVGSALALLASQASAREVRARPVTLPDAYFAARLAEMWPLLASEEIAAFEALTGGSERLAFLESAWKARDPTPASPRNEVRTAYEERLRQGYERLGPIAATDPDDARLRLIALLGEPDEVLTATGSRTTGAAAILGASPGDPGPPQTPSDCPVPPVELFVYHPRAGRPGLSLLLRRTEEGWRLHEEGSWIRGITNGLVLLQLERRRCRDQAGAFVEAAALALEQPTGWEDALELADLPAPRADWLDSLRDGALDLTGDEAPVRSERELLAVFTSRRVETSVDPRRPWRLRRQSVIDVDALVALDVALDVDHDLLVAQPWISLRLRGEVFSPAGRNRGLVVRRFAQDRLVLPPRAGPVELPLSFSAPSGSQLLVLHVADETGRFAQVLAYELEIPLVPASGDRESVAEHDRGLLEQLDRMPSLRLRLPDAVMVGERPVQAITRGEVARVEYRLDGELAGEAETPPFEASLEFGRLPLEQGLEAIGLDAQGRQVASDRLVVNPGLQRLRLDLVELTELPGAVRARARLIRPVGARLDRIEWFVDDRRLVVTSQEPLIEILPLAAAPGQPPPRFVRAVAHLEDGRTVEDTRFLSSDALVERMEVDLVQLFVRVTDRRGRKIEDLEAEEVLVLEDGEPQTLRTFDHATELPLQLALLVDVSASMLEQIELVRAAATAFLERTLRARDQGAILAFRNAPSVIAPFGPAPEWVSETVTRFEARGGTALWDSVALSAYYAQGLVGKKAVVVVTDGDDRDSDLTSTDVEELAQRMGVAVYVIALGIVPSTQTDVRASTVDHRRPLLNRLAENTGGRYSSALGQKGLHEALEAIERDLRSQYVVTFQSRQEGDGFRRLEVEVSRPGVRAGTMAGYYP